MSLSRFIGEVLRERRLKRNEYEAAMRRYFANDFVIPRARGERWLTREEINDRAAMRKEHEAALRKEREANERARIRRR